MKCSNLSFFGKLLNYKKLKGNIVEKKIWKAINDFKMFENATSIVVGVSGGIDSVSLLHFLKKILKTKKLS